jgi:hypothetical protein
MSPIEAFGQPAMIEVKSRPTCCSRETAKMERYGDVLGRRKAAAL